MGFLLPDIAVKYLVSRHPLPLSPSRTPEEYDAAGYRLVEDVLPLDLVDQLCAVGGRGELGRHCPLGPQPRWWAPANRPGNGEQVATLGTQKNLCKLHRGRAMATTRPTRGTWCSKSVAMFC